MQRIPGLERVAERCLATERWNSSVVCMLADAGITSTGVGYFSVVVPRVRRFQREFVQSGRITSLEELAEAEVEELLRIWGNRRSWRAVIEVAGELTGYSDDDVQALRRWASSTELSGWSTQPIGRVRGVGINTFQYLRMMGGVDTVMPDRIVRRFLQEAAGHSPGDELELVRLAEGLAKKHGMSAVELCFTAWVWSCRDKEKAVEELLRI